jgi:hypothetical protein
MSSPRSDALRAIATRAPIIPKVPALAEPPVPTSAYFGSNTFGMMGARVAIARRASERGEDMVGRLKAEGWKLNA